MLGQKVCRRDEVGHIGREVGAREIPVAVAESREVEAQRGHSMFGESATDAVDRRQILAAREAVGQQGIGLRGPEGRIQLSGKSGSEGSRKGEGFAMYRGVTLHGLSRVQNEDCGGSMRCRISACSSAVQRVNGQSDK